MSGWKTWFASLLLVANGIGILAIEAIEGTWNLREGVFILSLGVAFVGIGHKLDRLKR